MDLRGYSVVLLSKLKFRGSWLNAHLSLVFFYSNHCSMMLPMDVKEELCRISVSTLSV